MSCDPHSEHCREVIAAVYLYLDGEIEPSEQHAVTEHLDDCVACLQEYGLERVIIDLVRRCGGGDCAPPEVHARVLTMIRAAAQGQHASSVSVTVSRQLL